MPTIVSDYTAILSDSSWSGEPGTPTVVTYSFEAVAQDYLAGAGYSQEYLDSFQQFTNAQRALTQSALNAWAEASGIVFVEVAPGEGEMRFANYDFTHDPNNGGFSGYGYYPGRFIGQYGAFESDLGGDIFINTSRIANMSWGLIAHEIGHAIGMEHPFDGDLILDAPFDNGAYTIMSYNRGSVSSLGTFDVQAVQHLYGTPDFTPSTTGGITSFNVDAAALRVTQSWGNAGSGIAGTALADVIDAGGGDDTVGGFGGDDNLSGAGGNDLISGGGGNDRIDGGAGEDSIRAGEGTDTVIGGADNDTLIGGDDSADFSGSDVLDYTETRNGIFVDLDRFTGGTFIAGFAEGAEIGTDQIYGFSNILGGSGNDTLEGTRFDNLIEGRNGDDEIEGGNGSDTLRGGIGNDLILGGEMADTLLGDGGFDTLQGDEGNDLINGGAGADLLRGGAGDDFIIGEDGFDNIYGDAGNDTLYAGSSADRVFGGDGDDLIRGGINIGGSVDGLQGDAGNDTIYGEGGFDLLNGGTGDDLLDGGNQADNLYGEAGNDTLLGGNGFDRLFGGDGDDLLDGGTAGDALLGGTGHDTMRGGDGNDRLLGGSGNDDIEGGIGNDSLYGNAGFDTLTGGAGDDLLRGDFNGDTFVFADGHGHDTIIDFDALSALEVIDFSGIGSFRAFIDIMRVATQVGTSVEIATGADSSVTLLGVNRADLDAGDFLY
ncbi:hypothetical protein BOO69_16010 [Sulfitobacter alexandrii]|uniref:Peptidase metallopeptidase domain-containing protein n=1 Tax=Sulfitobacter alexandrii TaxID=1917485 RepID=A0A1J0WKR0_9RHOB|nr:matrixin family metalloprotease [Sulfitobacter alexandrii]APE44744.1 hypothetical protein BOO69_16010 [Sulfitobacter alexandrii]